MTTEPSQRSRTAIDTTSWITLRWTRGTRYYRLHLEQDLVILVDHARESGWVTH
jgi:hypothetical protein